MNRRPRLELHGSTASPEEAAAVMAAIEQFLRDTTPPPAPAEEPVNPWIRAARARGGRARPGHDQRHVTAQMERRQAVGCVASR